MLSLERQNNYRAQFAALWPGWQPSGPIYEDLVRRYALAGAYWLDVGCGRGGIVELLGQAVAACVGLDTDHASLQKHRANWVNLSVGQVEKLPFVNGCFDLVTCSWVIEHLPNARPAFAEIRRVLRPGGHLVFLTPNALNYITWLNRLAPGRLQRRLVQRLYRRDETDTFPVYYRANSPGRLDSLLKACDLRRAEMHLVGDPTYLAFTPALFRLGAAIEQVLPRAWRVHIVGDYVAD